MHTTIDRAGLAEFLRRRRDALQPEDVGLPRGQRRRIDGLRREEVAALSHMSSDYYARLERGSGPLLLVYTAAPGTDSYEKLKLLGVLAPRSTP